MVRHSPIRQRRTEAEDFDLVLTECRLGAGGFNRSGLAKGGEKGGKEEVDEA